MEMISISSIENDFNLDATVRYLSDPIVSNHPENKSKSKSDKNKNELPYDDKWMKISSAKMKSLYKTKIFGSLERKNKEDFMNGKIIEIFAVNSDTIIKKTYKVNIGSYSYLLVTSTIKDLDKSKKEQSVKFCKELQNIYSSVTYEIIEKKKF